MQTVTVAELRSALDSGPCLIDVREPGEFAMSHVPGARLVPLATVPEVMPELPTDEPIYVICEVGARSAHAAAFLRQQGFNARNVAGGTRGWLAAGYPVDF
jgi:rhodanese-related sulfurtransferase